MAHFNILTIHHSLSNFYLKNKTLIISLSHGYMFGKQIKTIHQYSENKIRNFKLGKFLDCDILDKINIISVSGSQFYMVVKDNDISYRFIYFAKQKFEAFNNFQQIVEIILHEKSIFEKKIIPIKAPSIIISK